MLFGVDDPDSGEYFYVRIQEAKYFNIRWTIGGIEDFNHHTSNEIDCVGDYADVPSS